MIEQFVNAVPLNVVLGGGLAVVGSVIGASMQHRYAHRREVKAAVYRPIFDETHKISTYGEIPYNPTTGKFESVYRNLDAYQKFYAKEHIGGQMTMLEGSLNSLERLIPVYGHYLDEIFSGSQYGETMRDSALLTISQTSARNIDLQFTNSEWAKSFYMPFVKTESRENLRENLEEYCWDNTPNDLLAIEMADDDFLDLAWEALQLAERSRSAYLPRDTTYETYLEIRERARMISEEIGKQALGVLDKESEDMELS